MDGARSSELQIPRWASSTRRSTRWGQLGMTTLSDGAATHVREAGDGVPPGRRRYKMSRLKPRPTKQAQRCCPDPSLLSLGTSGRRYKSGAQSCAAAGSTRDNDEYA